MPKAQKPPTLRRAATRRSTRPRYAPATAYPVVAVGVCRFCLRRTPTGRGWWCSSRCVQLYLIRRSGTELRKALFDRDLGVCQRCHLDTTFLQMILTKWRKSRRPKVSALAKEFRLTLEVGKKRRTYWDADHVLAVKDGGGSSPLSNIRTLCIWCHKNRTAEQHDEKANRAAPPRPSGSDLVRPVLSALRERAKSLGVN